MGDVIEINSDDDSDLEIIGETVAPAPGSQARRRPHVYPAWHRFPRLRGLLCSPQDNIDLTGDENEVNNAEEGMGNMQVNLTNWYRAEKSPQPPVSSNLGHVVFDSDEDLSDDCGEGLSPGLQSNWMMGKDEPDLDAPPVLTVEVTTEESSLISITDEGPLPELDFIALDETQDSDVRAATTSSQMSSCSCCSINSASDTSINSDVESLEIFSPYALVLCSSPSSAGDLLEDYLKSNFDEPVNGTVAGAVAGLSTDTEGIPSLIPQKFEEYELDHAFDHSPPSITMPFLENWEPLQTPDNGGKHELNCLPVEDKAQAPVPALDQSGDRPLSTEESEDHRLASDEASPNCSVDKELLQSFQYFIGAPIQHLFVKRHRSEKWHKRWHPFQQVNRHSWSSATHQNGSKEPELISQRQRSMINSTVDENFPQGTLQFLMDFVSPQHYPPHKIVEYVIKKILLGNESSSTIMSAYMTLMKIQQLHPANISTVQWDWGLLAYHVENKDPHRKHSLTRNDRLLFLQYVVQTLEDDFQLKHDVPQHSIAKTVLSCDDKFSNVRSVIKWLIDTISKDSDDIQQKNGPMSSSSDSPQVLDSRNPSAICLLQKMLTLAVEVDRSPTCSSNKIAEAIFQHFMYITKRSQRLTMLRSMESQLLRCKLLEFLFHHCTKKQNTLPMSLGKVLHFLKYAKFPLETDERCSSKWQYWDELVNLLSLLLLSYQEVTKCHLRISITERVKYVLANTPPMLTTHDKITVEEVLSDMEEFYNRVSSDLGKPLNPQLEEQINLLKALLLCAATGT